MTGSAVETSTPPDEDAHGATPSIQRSNMLLRGFAMFENILMALLLVSTVVTILAQIFFRWALEKPLSWSTEVATDLLVYIAFVGFAIGIRDNAHVAMRLFERRFGLTARRWLRLGELLVLGAVLVSIGIGGATYSIEQHDVVSPAGIPLWVAFAPLPLGAVLGTVHLVVEIVSLLRGDPVIGSEEPDEETPETAGGVA